MSTDKNQETFEALVEELDSLLEKTDEEVETKDDPGVFSASGSDEAEVAQAAEEAVAGAAEEGAEEAEKETADAAEGEETEEASEEESSEETAGEEVEEEAEEAAEEEAEEEEPSSEEEKTAEEDVEAKTDEETETVQEDVEVKTEEDSTEESEEVKGGRRVVMVPVSVDDDDEGPAEEYKDQELVSRRQQLMSELAEVNQQLSSQGYGEDDEDEDEMRMRRARRRAHMIAMGMKEEDIDQLTDEAMLCAVEQKVLPTSEPCAFCRGGCAREGKSLPGLLDVVAEAAESFKGTVLESGYAPNDNLFVVDVKTEDGRLIEAFYTGAGEPAGWVLLNQEIADRMEAEGKDALAGRKVISMAEAEEIAVKSIDGAVLGVDAAIFEGYDAWAVQIEAVDGKSYDAYVGLDGTVLGFDEFEAPELSGDLTPEEKSEIKAIEGELYFKRQFSSQRREELAKEGTALPDGSFPITTTEDLRNAIQAFGRAKNPALAKAHIMKRAAQLGQEDLIPDNWKADKATDDNILVKELMELQIIEAELDMEEDK